MGEAIFKQGREVPGPCHDPAKGPEVGNSSCSRQGAGPAGTARDGASLRCVMVPVSRDGKARRFHLPVNVTTLDLFLALAASWLLLLWLSPADQGQRRGGQKGGMLKRRRKSPTSPAALGLFQTWRLHHLAGLSPRQQLVASAIRGQVGAGFGTLGVNQLLGQRKRERDWRGRGKAGGGERGRGRREGIGSECLRSLPSAAWSHPSSCDIYCCGLYVSDAKS